MHKRDDLICATTVNVFMAAAVYIQNFAVSGCKQRVSLGIKLLTVSEESIFPPKKERWESR